MSSCAGAVAQGQLDMCAARCKMLVLYAILCFCVLQESLQQGCAGMLCVSAGCEGKVPGGVHQEVYQISDPDRFAPLGQVCDG